MIGILAALSLAHGLNDAMQSIISAIYPLLKTSLNLSYAEIGIVALTYQISASIMQPIFGYAFDKRPIGWQKARQAAARAKIRTIPRPEISTAPAPAVRPRPGK